VVSKITFLYNIKTMLPTSDKSKNDEEKTSTTELIEHMTRITECLNGITTLRVKKTGPFFI